MNVQFLKNILIQMKLESDLRTGNKLRLKVKQAAEDMNWRLELRHSLDEYKT